MEQAGLWTRMTQWLTRRSPGAAAGGLPRLGRDGLLQGLQADAPMAVEVSEESPVRKLSKQQLREETLARLEDGHQRVLALMESIGRHMDAQDRQGQAVVQSLEDIGGHLMRMTQSVVKQGETLGAVAAQMQAAGDRARRLEESLAGWPALAESQRTTLTMLADHVSAERQAVDRIGDLVQTHGGVLMSVERATEVARDLLRNIHVSAARTEQEMMDSGRRQGKWLVMLFAATATVALLAATLVVVALVR